MHLLEDFIHQVARQPQRAALLEDNRQLSYHALAWRAGGIAKALRRLAIPREHPIAIALPRGIDASCAVLGILASGHCYLPLDPKAPPQRGQWIVNDARAGAVIGRLPPGDSSLPWLNIDSIAPAPLEPLQGGAETLAAILYTSGSTGTPKGVALSQRALHAFCRWGRELVSLGPQDRIAAIAPLHFDLSTFDLFAVLSAGATTHFLPEKLTMAPSRLTSWLAEWGISGFYTVPSLLCFWSWKGNLSTALLPRLRFILFAGEAFPSAKLRRLAQQLPHVPLHNLYGPTETNVCCHWPVDPERLTDDHPIPIGAAACGDRLHLDPETGELWVRGPTLSSGYWRAGKLTPHLNPQGWYPTGDRVTTNGSGEYVYLGRLDRMLKVSGHRVEPAEIEATLLSLPEVEECAVVGLETPDDAIVPAAVVVMNAALPMAKLRRHLQQHLPSYMLPAKIQSLAALPRLSNGKPDLAAIQACFAASGPSPSPPPGDTHG